MRVPRELIRDCAEDCPYCVPWGDSVPCKAKCCKPPFSGDFRFSVVLGGACQCPDDPQMNLFEEAR